VFCPYTHLVHKCGRIFNVSFLSERVKILLSTENAGLLCYSFCLEGDGDVRAGCPDPFSVKV
jgi:hypothetical protein